MKIVYFNYLQNAIGPIIRTLELAKASADNGVEVSLHFLHPRFAPPEFVYQRIKTYQGLRLHIHYDKTHEQRLATVQPPAAIATGAKAAGEPRMRLLGLLKQAVLSLGHIPEEVRILRTKKPDAIMARPDQAFSFCISSRLTGIPLILDTDGPVEELDLYWGISSRWFKSLDTLRGKLSHAILVVSQVCADLWKEKLDDPEKLFIAPNGTHPEEFAPSTEADRESLKRSLNLDGCRIIGYSGNQRIWHGLPNLLRSALPLLQDDPKLKILIIGCGLNDDLMESCGIPESIFRNQIVFTSRLSYWDMAKHIDLSDIMVMPYERIPLFYFSPMRMFEAMSLGKSIITSKQGQMTDLLDERAAVRFLDLDRKESLRECLKESIYDQAFIAQGQKNRDYLIAEHTWFHRGQTVVEAIKYAKTKKSGGGAV